MLVEILNAILCQSNFWSLLSYSFLGVYIITVVLTALIVLLENRSPEKTITWLLVLLLLPVVGFIFYIFFGRNFRKRKMFSRKAVSDLIGANALSRGQPSKNNPENLKENVSVPEKINVAKLLLSNNKSTLTYGNYIKLFHHGQSKFEAVAKAIKKAHHHIHLEYYIIEDDKIGNYIKDLLIEKLNKGVSVRLIIDGIGSRNLSARFINELKDAGAEVYVFMPVRFPLLTTKINYRNHRKIIVIDGKTGFVGGINIADRYIHGTPEIGEWRDTHLMLEGDAVKSLQFVFLIDWYFVSKNVLREDVYFPLPTARGEKAIQIVTGGPDSDWAEIMQAYFTAITLAREYIYISTPYFIPNESILTALRTAALNGKDVRLLIPKKSDSRLALWCTMSYVPSLLKAGIKVYLYTKGFNHSKVLIIDDSLASVGSANMDLRSFDDNFEVNAVIYDKDLTIELKNQFLKDLEGSEIISEERFSKRPMAVRLRESSARLLSPLL